MKFFFKTVFSIGLRGRGLPTRLMEIAAGVLWLALFCDGASADWDYWIVHGNQKVVACEGAHGSFVKLANADGQWIYIDGIATCRDTGQDYVYSIRFVRVGINNARLTDIVRDPLKFDWIGLAVYRDDSGAQRVNWLYDEARPIQGALPKNSKERISFGGMEFKVPKTVVSQATRFTFYLTAQGIPFTFGAL